MPRALLNEAAAPASAWAHTGDAGHGELGSTCLQHQYCGDGPGPNLPPPLTGLMDWPRPSTARLLQEQGGTETPARTGAAPHNRRDPQHSWGLPWLPPIVFLSPFCSLCKVTFESYRSYVYNSGDQKGKCTGQYC